VYIFRSAEFQKPMRTIAKICKTHTRLKKILYAVGEENSSETGHLPLLPALFRRACRGFCFEKMGMFQMVAYATSLTVPVF